MNKLSEPMKRVIRNLAAGRKIDHGISGQSAYGGLTGTICALHRRGVLGPDGELTDHGRKLAEQLK